MISDADTWIERLALTPHPEGGHFRETYRSRQRVRVLEQDGEARERTAATAIYFLLRRGEHSRFHRLRSDEQWHFLAGAPLDILCVTPAGLLEARRLGDGTATALQATIPAQTWFAAVPVAGADADFSLVACTVAPGFEFEDFELAEPDALAARCMPEVREKVRTLCRPAASAVLSPGHHVSPG